jgi:ribonuclease D
MDYLFIENEADLRSFIAQNQNISWLAFDTEFVGEKRFYTLLCLIQVATEHGLYLIDPLKIEDLSPFLALLENGSILKITHAGDNDYRVLNTLFGTIPKNIFDTQVAAGFMSSVYPMSFQKLLEKELSVRISKSFAVTDWEARPLSPKHLKYALNDVVHLCNLYTILKEKLEKSGRIEWLTEELSKLEDPRYYETDINREALNSNLIPMLSAREQVFLVRLYQWRRSEAERKNVSKEMAFPAKLIHTVVKNINEGKDALRHNRLIPDRTLFHHWDMFNEMYQAKMTEEERVILTQIPKYTEETPRQALTTELLYVLVKHRCLEHHVASSLVLPKSSLKDNEDSQAYQAEYLNQGWRKELLGEELLRWIKRHSDIDDFEIKGKECLVRMK